MMSEENRANIFYIFVAVSIVISIFFTYRRAFVTRDFEIIQDDKLEEVAPAVESSTTTEGFEVSSTTASTTINQ